MAVEDRMAAALRKKFGSPRGMLRAIGFDENTMNEVLGMSPYIDDRHDTGDRRRAVYTFGGNGSRDAEDRRRRAADRHQRYLGRDEGERTADGVSEILKDLIMELPQPEHEELLEELRDIVDGGSLSQWVNEDSRRAEDRRGRRRRAQDRFRGNDPGNRRGAADDPPPFSGRPRPGGGMDPIDDRRHAQDARPRRGVLTFEQLHGRSPLIDS